MDPRRSGVFDLRRLFDAPPEVSNRPPVGPEGHDVLTSLQALLGSVMARLAKRLEVASIPEKELVALMSDDMITHGRGFYVANLQAEHAKRLLG